MQKPLTAFNSFARSDRHLAAGENPAGSYHVKAEMASAYWRSVDIALFYLIVGRGRPNPWLLRCACLTAAFASWPLMTIMVLHTGLEASRWIELSLCLLLSGNLQWVAKRLAYRWNAPRPFALGLIHNHLNHSARGGFPSAHAVVMGTIAGFCSLWMPSELLVGVLLLVAGTTWARVYTGAHFPLDVIFGSTFGGIIGSLAAWWVLPLTASLGHMI